MRLRSHAIALLVIAAGLFATAALLIGALVSDHCGAYPDGYRCSAAGYALIVGSCAAGALAVVALLLAAAAAVRRARRARQAE